MCHDTGYRDYAALKIDPCDHRLPDFKDPLLVLAAEIADAYCGGPPKRCTGSNAKIYNAAYYGALAALRAPGTASSLASMPESPIAPRSDAAGAALDRGDHLTKEG